ncbi:MAG: GNAT family N-acetyltransferase, partial [Candidatus Omnitrophica bacterium]|nr:GNAT family N-acetyltransferase [Candidatus Omnitrophota bacterium]
LEIKEVLDEFELCQVYELYMQTYYKQGGGIEKLPVDFFRIVSLNMPRETKYFLWRAENKIVAFALCFVRKDEFIDYYLGFDYSQIKRYYLYFVRFRGLLKWCIEHKIKRYEMGVTSYESKRRLGFKFIRLYFYIKCRNPILNKLVPFLKIFFSPEHFDPVFKEMNLKKE